jgi:hypothetical protein
MPQFLGSDVVSTQVFAPLTLQDVMVAPHGFMHELPMQAGVEPMHLVPHVPQFWGSSFVSTQFPPQSVVPPEHTMVQAPATQDWPVGHAMPHEPQFALSVVTDVQTVPHIVWPVGQPIIIMPLSPPPSSPPVPLPVSGAAASGIGGGFVPSMLPPSLVMFMMVVSPPPPQPALTEPIAKTAPRSVIPKRTAFTRDCICILSSSRANRRWLASAGMVP